MMKSVKAIKKLHDAAPALLESCKELFSLAVAPENFTEATRQTILDSAWEAMRKAGFFVKP